VDGINKILFLSVYSKNKEIGFAMQYTLYRETEKNKNNLGKKGK
jgi:hypothetical protein